MKTYVYSIIVTLTDDLLQNELDNIYPTFESAVRNAKKIGAYSSVYEVSVYLDEVTEELGRQVVRKVYTEKHKERLGQED